MKYTIRTDLALENLNILKEHQHYSSKITSYNDITVTEIELKSGEEIINKKKGFYTTIEFNEINSNLEQILIKYLKKFLEIENIKEESKAMIIGLGNELSTPDSLGPLTINNIFVTNHLFSYKPLEGYRKVSAINPGVMGETGLETNLIIKSIIKEAEPDFIIVVDALASKSVSRVNKTIQMTNTGITPGSGIGNARKEISKESLKVPVISIGVPTVVDAVTIVSDTLNYLCKHFTYMKKNIDNPKNRLIPITSIDYSKTETNQEDKKELLGNFGSLSEEEIRQLIFEVLTPVGANLIVTPKDIDFKIKELSDLIGSSINKTLHKKFTKN